MTVILAVEYGWAASLAGCGPFGVSVSASVVDRADQTASLTMSACGPFWPCEISNSTR